MLPVTAQNLSSLSRVLGFIAVDTREGLDYFTSREGIYGKGVYLFSSPKNALKASRDPVTLLVFALDPRDPNVVVRNGIIGVLDTSKLKHMVSIPLAGKIDSIELKEHIPKGFSVRETSKSASTIQNVLSKAKKRKYKRVQLPLRTRLDYGVPK